MDMRIGASVLVSRGNGEDPQRILAEIGMISTNQVALMLFLPELIKLGNDPINGGMLIVSTLALMRIDNGNYRDLLGHPWKVEPA